MLASLGADVDQHDEKGRTPVFAAALNGHEQVVRLLGELGANVHASVTNHWLGAGATPVYAAACKGHEQVVRLLATELGADVNHATVNGDTPVSAAARQGHTQVVETLAEAGANVVTTDNKGSSPVFLAAVGGHEQTVRALAKLGADINQALTSGILPIFAAIQCGHEQVVRALVEAGCHGFNGDGGVLTHYQSIVEQSLQSRHLPLLTPAISQALSGRLGEAQLSAIVAAYAKPSFEDWKGRLSERYLSAPEQEPEAKKTGWWRRWFG